MNITRMNLNLLIALDALLTERNVTRAGNRMFITQSAMSNVLKQLREQFQDDLLVQTGRTMTLTPRAQMLHPQIRQFLSQAESIFSPVKFDAKTSERIFTIGLEEYTAFLIMPALYAYINKHASNVRIHVKYVPLFGEKALLEKQEIDIAVGLLQKESVSQSISYELLFRDDIVCLANAKHPDFKKNLTLKKYLAAKHISFFRSQEDTPHIVDALLNNMGYERSIALRMSNIVPGLYTLAQSNLIATVPRRLANEANRLLKLAIQPCPFSMPEVAFVQMWHPISQTDSGCQWLRDTIGKIARQVKK